MVERTIERVRALPGARAAAVTTGLPMSGRRRRHSLQHRREAAERPEDYKLAGYRAVSAGYFEALGIPLRKGRTLTDRDRQGAPLVAVINESMARQYFSDVDPIGQRFAIGTEPDAESPFIEIVGVVGDVKQSFEAGAKAEYYLPYVQYPHPVLAGHVPQRVARRANGGRSSVARLRRCERRCRRSIRDQPLVKVRTMEQAIARLGRAAAAAHRAAHGLCRRRRHAGAFWRLRRDGLHGAAADAGDRRARGARRVAR